MTENDPAESLEQSAARLTETLAELRETIAAANDVQHQLDAIVDRNKANKLTITVISIIIGFMVAIIVAMILFGIQLQRVVQNQKDAALCPLYEIFINADTPRNEEVAKQRGDNIEDRRRNFQIIRDSYEALGCVTNERQ